MIIGLRRFGAISVVAIGLSVVGCDSGAPSKTQDEIASDSALASDLALANRDTLLVDSIGEYRPPDAAERDTAGAGDIVISSPQPQSKVGDTGAAPPPGKKTDPVQAPLTVPPPATTEPPNPVVRIPAPLAPAPPPIASGPTRRGTAACSSRLKADQEECLRAILPAADKRLNGIYRALVTEMRRLEGVRGRGADPASVERLRVSQRSWLVYRDNQCRRRGRGKEGALWARPRVRCLGEFSNRRANELADQFSRLTAH
ncbi:MAG TPA: lysozyme inhibitor LprI family protein [Gemmatimonadaceae bacterium]|nr:lysozyme inhibitor LprI family protein [Gemmatimonadaceae bacterium]